MQVKGGVGMARQDQARRIEEELAVDLGRQNGRKVVLPPDGRTGRPDVVEPEGGSAVKVRDQPALGF